MKIMISLISLLIISMSCIPSGRNSSSAIKGANGSAYWCMMEQDNASKCIKFWKQEPQEEVSTLWFETKNSLSEVDRWNYDIQGNIITLTWSKDASKSEQYYFEPIKGKADEFIIGRNLTDVNNEEEGKDLKYLRWSNGSIWVPDVGSASRHFFSLDGEKKIALNHNESGVNPGDNTGEKPGEDNAGGDIPDGNPPISENKSLRVCYVADVFGNSVDPVKCINSLNDDIKDWDDFNSIDLNVVLGNHSITIKDRTYHLTPVHIQLQGKHVDKRKGFVLRGVGTEGCVLAQLKFPVSGMDKIHNDACAIFQLYEDKSLSNAFTESIWANYFATPPTEGSCNGFGGVPTCLLPNSKFACTKPGDYCPPLYCDGSGNLQNCPQDNFCKPADTGSPDSCQPF